MLHCRQAVKLAAQFDIVGEDFVTSEYTLIFQSFKPPELKGGRDQRKINHSMSSIDEFYFYINMVNINKNNTFWKQLLRFV